MTVDSHPRPGLLAASRVVTVLGLALAPCACADRDRGLEVTRCEPWGAAARAGIEAGDRLLAWRTGGETGTLVSPLELFLLEIGHGPAEAVELAVARSGREPGGVPALSQSL